MFHKLIENSMKTCNIFFAILIHVITKRNKEKINTKTQKKSHNTYEQNKITLRSRKQSCYM